jgi:hypothetical protein
MVRMRTTMKTMLEMRTRRMKMRMKTKKTKMKTKRKRILEATSEETSLPPCAA